MAELPDFGLKSIAVTGGKDYAAYDAVLIVTAHSSIDYRDVVKNAQLVVDFRNATAGIPGRGNVWKL